MSDTHSHIDKHIELCIELYISNSTTREERIEQYREYMFYEW